jgi:hypothetical protein
MSLSDLNTTPTHDRGITHHVIFHHPKRDDLGQIVFDDNGPVIDRSEALMNDGKPVELIIAGPDSDRVSMGQLISFDLQRRADFDERPITTQESIEGNLARWCSAVIGWNNLPRGWVDKSGKDEPIEYKAEHARAMFSQTGMTWLGAQVDGVLLERNRFLPQSSATSESTPKPSPKPQSASHPRSRPA